MAVSVRSMTGDEHAEILDLLAVAFDNGDLREFFRRHQLEDPGWARDQHRVVDVDGHPVAHLWIAPRSMRYGVARLPFGGIADVATHPDHRGQGHCSRLLTDAVERMTAARQPLSVLLTGQPDVYTGRGWHPLDSDWIEATVPTDHIDEAAGFTIRAFEPSDLPHVMDAYNDLSAENVGPLDRSEAYWTAMPGWVASKPDAANFTFDVLMHVRQVVAYMLTRIKGDHIEILDAGIEYEDLGRPFLRLWQTRAKDHGVAAISGRLHHTHPLATLLAKEAGGRSVARPGILMRLNSLAGALEAVRPELVRRRRRAAPLAGPPFTIAVDDERVRIETPVGDLVIAPGAGDDSTLTFTAAEFLDVLMGTEAGAGALAAQPVSDYVKVFATRLFPNTGYQYWLADLF